MKVVISEYFSEQVLSRKQEFLDYMNCRRLANLSHITQAAKWLKGGKFSSVACFLYGGLILGSAR